MQARHAMAALIPHTISHPHLFALYQLISPSPRDLHNIMKRVKLIPHNSLLILEAIEVLIHKFQPALVHHGQHIWEFLRVLEVLSLDCFECALCGVIFWADGVEWGSLFAFDVAAYVFVAHHYSRLLSI